MAGKSKPGKSKSRQSFPSKEDILDFVESSESKIGKREIARAFNIRGSDRVQLKQLLKEMADEGLLTGHRSRLRRQGKLPKVTVLEIVEQDSFGDYVGEPANWEEEEGNRPRVLIQESGGKNSRAPSVGIGDRALCRIQKADPLTAEGYLYQASVIKKLPRNRVRLLGIYRNVRGRGGVIDPIDKKQLREWTVPKGDEGGAKDGELVTFEIQKAGRFGLAKARVLSTLGNPDDQGAISLIAIHNAGLPHEFSERVTEELKNLKAPRPRERTDLRHIPFITIDPSDARDHDDAVWAAPDDEPGNENGWIVYVAIADVAHFVRPGTAIDREAEKRGNSVYFPDRVVPMLPEKLSNDLCSLKEGVDRSCLAAKMVFDKSGKKIRHEFIRGLMRSAAKLSYDEAQAAIDNAANSVPRDIYQSVLQPLWQAYKAVDKARKKRAPLDLDLPERKIILDDKGRVSGVTTPERLDAHRLIEEFMIQANVAAAETLERKKNPLIYRVHAPPSREKLINLGKLLDTLKISHKSLSMDKPEPFNRILQDSRGGENSELISEVVLRSQSQAEYAEKNYGHFGLNLRRYAHFTSPIRRYADLIVHRALISALGLGKDGLTDREIERLEEISEHISQTERRAMAAERETHDRLIAAYHADQIGESFSANISGVTKSGLFIRLHDSGADGFIAISTLGQDYFIYDENSQSLIGEKSGIGYRLGDKVEVRLVEAVPSAGALRFTMLSEGRADVKGSVRISRNKGRKPVKRGKSGRKSRRR